MAAAAARGGSAAGVAVEHAAALLADEAAVPDALALSALRWLLAAAPDHVMPVLTARAHVCCGLLHRGARQCRLKRPGHMSSWPNRVASGQRRGGRDGCPSAPVPGYAVCLWLPGQTGMLMAWLVCAVPPLASCAPATLWVQGRLLLPQRMETLVCKDACRP